jgi:hypothetical protein
MFLLKRGSIFCPSDKGSWFWALFLKVQKIESKIHQQTISPKVVET